jgi:hypothetical protein
MGFSILPKPPLDFMNGSLSDFLRTLANANGLSRWEGHHALFPPGLIVVGADSNTAPVDPHINLEYERPVVKRAANLPLSKRPSRQVSRRRFCANLC